MILVSLFLSNIIVHPDKRTIALIISFIVAIFFLSVQQKYLFMAVLILAFFPQYLRGQNTTNFLVILLAASFFIRVSLGQQCIISLKRITGNLFFLPSIFIWLSYLLAWLIAYGNHSFQLSYHTNFFIGISCALLLANIIIGYVHDLASFRVVQGVFLALLFLNLFFGAVFYLKPGLVIIPGLIEDRTVFVGYESSMRLGGLTFFWEAYAEYLMMAMVILLGLLINRIYKERRILELFLVLLFLLTIVELLLTNTRGAIFGASLGSILVIVLFSNLNLAHRFVTVFLFLFICGTAVFIAQASGQLTLFERMATLDITTMTEFGPMPSDRVKVWLPALNFLKEHGLAGFGPSMQPLIHTDTLRWPHNLILLILITVGIFGLAAYGYMLLRILLLQKKISLIADGEQRLFFQLLWVAFLLFLIDTMKFDGSLRLTNSYFYHIWICLGLLFSSINIPQGENHG